MLPVILYTTEVRLITHDGEISLYQTIRETMVGLLPEGWTYSESWFTSNKAKWQSILASGLKIEKGHIHNETQWPPLANTLIGYLLVRDLISQSLNKLLLVVGDGGTVKAIKTGPTEVSYHDTGRVLQNLFFKGGLFELYQSQICAMARTLKIHIRGCKSDQPIPPRVMYSSTKAYLNQIVDLNK